MNILFALLIPIAIVLIENEDWRLDRDKEFKEFDEPACPYDDPSKCKFCGSKDIRGGSWAPDICMDCKAVYFVGWWIRE